MYCLTVFLNTFRDGDIAEQEKEPSNNFVLDLGIDNVPLAVDLRERVWVCDVGFNKFDIYSGVREFAP